MPLNFPIILDCLFLEWSSSLYYLHVYGFEIKYNLQNILIFISDAITAFLQMLMEVAPTTNMFD